MRLINKLIQRFEEEAQDARRLASKYTEMKYNGHTHSLKSEINKNGKRSKL